MVFLKPIGITVWILNRTYSGIIRSIRGEETSKTNAKEILRRREIEAMPEASIFVAYSHHDEPLKDALLRHLAALRRTGLVRVWHDRKIEAGQLWERVIDQSINEADIIVLLISSNFIDSDYCYGIEMKRAMERHSSGLAIVVPVILKPCDWGILPLSKLQALPKDGKPIAIWANSDEALTDVAKRLREIVERGRDVPPTQAADRAALQPATVIEPPSVNPSRNACNTCGRELEDRDRCVTCGGCLMCLNKMGDRCWPCFGNWTGNEDDDDSPIPVMG